MDARHTLVGYVSSETILEAEIEVIEGAIGGKDFSSNDGCRLTLVRRLWRATASYIQEFVVLHPDNVWLLQGKLAMTAQETTLTSE